MKSFKPEPRDFDMQGLENYLVTINDFNVQTQIGKGGYGEVFYGIHIKTGRKVAIKKLILSRLDGSDLVYFNREVQILASCENYFLLPLIGYSNSYPYIIVTDFVPCGSLFEALRHKPGSPLLTDTMKTKIGLGIAIGMIALHDKNIIHRDLKSLNILITQETLPKICDFGIARFSDSGKDPSCPQKFFTANIGTPHWMAPEILQSGSYTQKVDVFSYAVILWELLTEALPFQGMKELYQVALKIISGERNPIPLNAPTGLKNLINRLWSQDPELRPDFREVYRSFASHEVYFGNTNHDEIDEFVKKFPMPTKPSEDEKICFNSENGINSGSYNSNSANFEENHDTDKNSEQNQENKDSSITKQIESTPNLEYINSIKDKLSNGPSKPVRPPKVIQPVKLNICVSNPQEKKLQTQTSPDKISTQNQIRPNKEPEQNISKSIPEPDNKSSNDSEISIQKELEEHPPPPPKQQFLYINKYLTKDNIFLQYFSDENHPSFLEGFNNDDIIEEEEEENDFDINKNTENEDENKPLIDTNQIITLTSSSSDDENYDEILNGSDTSAIENFGQLSILFHTLIKNINPENTKELINTISLLVKTNNKSIMFTTVFKEISILATRDPEFANLLIQTSILDYLPYDRSDLFNEILHIILSILPKEPEFITDEIMKKLFIILMKNVDEHQDKIKKETQKDFDEIIEKEEIDANYENGRKYIINDELTKEVIPFLCILEKIGDNIRYRDSIFDLYNEELELFINFSQFVDIIYYLSTHFNDFAKLQQNKLSIFSKAISLQSQKYDYSSVVKSGFNSLSRLVDIKYTESEIPLNKIVQHIKERGPQTIEGLIIVSKIQSISLTDDFIQALKNSTDFSEKASFIVANIAMNLASSSSKNEFLIFKSKIWLKILPQNGMKLILHLACKAKYQNEMIGDTDMVNYLTKALNYAKPDLVCAVISFIRYSKKFLNFAEAYSNAGFLHCAVDSTISSNNDKCIDQGLLLFDQLFHEGVWFDDFGYFVEKIAIVLESLPQKQAQRSIVALLALGVMFPQSHPIMKDYEIGKIVAKININSNSVNYRNNLLQILNQS